ncbi:hypothetical protein Hanom_Chr07g00607001 [Helianthus anomalus]
MISIDELKALFSSVGPSSSKFVSGVVPRAFAKEHVGTFLKALGLFFKKLCFGLVCQACCVCYLVC